MKKIFVNELKTGQDLIDQTFLVKSQKKLKTSSNKEYWSLTLGDKTGEIDAKVWEDKLDTCESAKEGDAVLISGAVNEYKGKKQLIIESMQITEDYEISDFLQQTSKDIDKMFKIIEKNISGMQNKHLKSLLNQFYKDEEFSEKFKQAPGAKVIHHAYVGGLLEHVSEMLGYAEPVLKDYPNINKDLLITGILLHDIGKIDELETNSRIFQTLKGKFVGHIPIGTIKVAKEMDKIKDFPEELKDKVLHLILSHHGKLEFGSPVKPQLLEAVVLNYLDELSSKTNIAAKAYELGVNTPEQFSDKQFGLEGTQIYLGKHEDNDENNQAQLI